MFKYLWILISHKLDESSVAILLFYKSSRFAKWYCDHKNGMDREFISKSIKGDL